MRVPLAAVILACAVSAHAQPPAGQAGPPAVPPIAVEATPEEITRIVSAIR
jgi:hypothetical protein